MIQADKLAVHELKNEIARLEGVVSSLTEARATANVDLEICQKELAKRTRPSPQGRISDHAVFRYLERVYDLDVESIRKEIMEAAKPAMSVGASSVKVNGIKFVIRDNVVTTVIGK